MKKTPSPSSALATYEIGLLHAGAYRILTQLTNEALTSFRITSIHWKLLGVLYAYGEPLRATHAAERLGVRSPFISVLIPELHELGYLNFKEDSSDKRAKLLSLTSRGKQFVEKTESYLRAYMREVLSNIPSEDLAAYMRVLVQIKKNTEGST